MTVLELDGKDKEVVVNLSKEETQIILYALTYITNYVTENEYHVKNDTIMKQFDSILQRL